VKARNCLIFQGDVESIASKNPRESSKFLEHISGSGELEQEYEEKKSAMDMASNDAIFNFQKKKGVSAERKELKEQKEEAESFAQKQKQLNDLKLQHYLFRLHQIDTDINNESELQERDAEKKNELTIQETVLKRQVDERKGAIGSLSLETKRGEKEVAKLKADLKKKDIELIKLKDEKDFHTRHLKEVESDKQKQQEAFEEALEKQEKLKRDIKEDIVALDKAHNDMASCTTVQLDESQLSEYERIRAEAGSKTAKLRGTLEGLKLDQQGVEDELHRVEEKFRELEELYEQFMENKRRLEDRKAKLSERMEEDKRKLPEFETKIRAIEKEVEGAVDSFNKIEKEIEEVSSKLSGARQDNRESNTQRNLQIAIDAMKRLYPGVLGRLFSLCKPRQTKYNLAVTTALGVWMDAIVVETEDTAKQCMKYLRDQRVGTAHFLPLNTLRPKDINERLRTLGSKYRLVIDVIEYDEGLEVAMKYACGNAIISNTLEDARTLAFTNNEKVKVVSLDGSVISKSGNMTGGITSSDERRAERWEEAEMDKLKVKRRELEVEKEYIRKQYGVVSGRQTVRGAKADEMETLKSEMKSLQNRLQYSAEDVKMSGKHCIYVYTFSPLLTLHLCIYLLSTPHYIYLSTFSPLLTLLRVFLFCSI
jgi:structural maintenance of chromosome 1